MSTQSIKSKEKDVLKKLSKRYGKKLYEFSFPTQVEDEKTKVTVICKSCKKSKLFSIGSLLHGISACTCSKNSVRNRYTTEGMIAYFKNKFKDKYSYPNTVYVNIKNKIKVVCNECNTEFEVLPNVFEHYVGGCSKCLGKSKTWSCQAIELLETISDQTGLFIQHAKNVKEHAITIGKKHYKADGFIKELNLIIEYHGDAFHGNPKIYKDDDLCNPFKWETAKELYEKTQLKEKLLKKSGYKVLTIWESDYKKNKEKTVAKAVKTINNLK